MPKETSTLLTPFIHLFQQIKKKKKKEEERLNLMETCVKMSNMYYEETELRLGLPGGEGETGKNVTGKRSFSETVDLKLHLQTDHGDNKIKEKNLLPCNNNPEKPPAPKAQVVGWPPVRSFRKNILAIQSAKRNSEEGEKGSNNVAFVKVSMDGAPYLRKVDLKMHKSYQDLSHALETMFNSCTSGNCGSQGMNGRDFMNESKLMDLLNGSDYVPTYEDKDGDWMLVGDVPWEMFVGSCKRLRIMKGSEAIGLAPRAVEKCKNRR